MFTLDFEFDVKIIIDKKEDNLFASTLYCITMDKNIGDISGNITRGSGNKIFTIDTTEIDNEYSGTGIGYKFYVQTIKRCFEYGCTEFRSSTTRNDYSERAWKKLERNFYNIEKKNKQYIVSLPDKQIL